MDFFRVTGCLVRRTVRLTGICSQDDVLKFAADTDYSSRHCFLIVAVKFECAQSAQKAQHLTAHPVDGPLASVAVLMSV